MSKGKLAKFAETKTFDNFFEPTRNEVVEGHFALKGRWHEYFGNKHPIVLELCCGRGEYTIGQAQLFPDKNFIGMDRKGARMWKGCRQSIDEGMKNVAFLRGYIDYVNFCFDKDEVSEIWITFPDPQPQKPRKRMTAPVFLDRYRQILHDEGSIHLKTDSELMYNFTLEVINEQQLTILENIDNLYALDSLADNLKIKTYYENMWLAQGATIRYINFSLNKKQL